LIRIVDLSQTIEYKMPVFSGDMPTYLFQSQFLENDHHNNYRLEVSMHCGTHIDSAMHMTNSEEYISELSVSNFIGNGFMLDVRNRQVITMEKQYEQLIENQSIVLLYTGYDKAYGTDEYYEDHPIIDNELCEFFVSKNIKMLGMDMPSPDYFPYDIHKLLFKNNICIIENLKSLDSLLNASSFEIIALPLKIKADSSIARVVARIH
jgi:kynurenine formamidase